MVRAWACGTVGNFLHNKNRDDYVLSSKVGKLLKASPHNNAKSLVRWVRNLMNEFDPPGYDDVAVISISVEPVHVTERQLTAVWSAGD